MIKNIKIRKGRHYSNEFKPKFFCKTPTRIEHSFNFTNSCEYSLDYPDHLDINKLFGIGFGLNHHKNSIRVGWRYSTGLGKIELLSYDYNYGSRSYNHITYIDLSKFYNISIRLNRKCNFYRIFIDNEPIIQVDYQFPNKFSLKTKLGCYFGGNQTAPKNLLIYKN